MTSGKEKYPLATLAPYGPTNKQATKLVVCVFPGNQPQPTAIRKWFVESGDVREDTQVSTEVTAFLKEHGVVQSVLAEKIMGCPHEEGVDYPRGAVCPQCSFWASRNRFTHQKEAEARSGPKTGRNDSCPCGSEKKFKKCCGAA